MTLSLMKLFNFSLISMEIKIQETISVITLKIARIWKKGLKVITGKMINIGDFQKMLEMPLIWQILNKSILLSTIGSKYSMIKSSCSEMFSIQGSLLIKKPSYRKKDKLLKSN